MKRYSRRARLLLIILKRHQHQRWKEWKETECVYRININSFQAIVALLYPLMLPKFSDVCRGYRSKTMTKNGLKTQERPPWSLFLCLYWRCIWICICTLGTGEITISRWFLAFHAKYLGNCSCECNVVLVSR